MLFKQPSFKNVIVNGTVLDKQGRKMSKSLKNSVDPMEVMSRFGAAATRWYFFSAVPIGNDYRSDLAAVQDVVRRSLLILWNTYGFFANYARLDGFDPAGAAVPGRERAQLDRWLLAELAVTIGAVGKAMEGYDPPTAARRLEGLRPDLSPWYGRRSPRRFWESESDADQRSAYQTLYRVLVSLAQLLAPFMPFVAETIYQNLAAGRQGQPESVHLCDWPVAGTEWRGAALPPQRSARPRAGAAGLAARHHARIN